MSWREREFSHESEAYYRSLDQVTGSSGEACMGYHVENGKSICDWFHLEHGNRKVKVRFEYGAPGERYLLVYVQGFMHPYAMLVREQPELISAARELALKVLQGR